MLSLAKARKDYYLCKLGAVSPREDYYLRGGTATGSWRGNGAAELGLEGTVSAESLVRLFDGQHPTTGEQLGRRIRNDGVAAWDLTFSADKSVSLLWALGDADARQQVLEAFDEATAEAVSYLESVASSTRGAARMPVMDGDGQPLFNEDGSPQHRVETWPIRTSGYVAACFTEFTSRADDPQLHTHVVVGNRVQGVDGVWRALDGRLLFGHRLAAGYLHEAVLRRELTKRLGVRWQPVEKGMADIEGFTREQVMAFSQRHQEIESWVQDGGLVDTPASRRVAAIASRNPKQDDRLDELLPRWRERAAEVGLTPERIAGVTGRSSEITSLSPEVLVERLAAAEGLTANESTFARDDVIKATAAALPEGGARDEIERFADAFLQDRKIIPILPSQPPADRIDLPRSLTDEEQQLLKQSIDRSRTEPLMRRRDGSVFPGLVNERRYTTAELLAIEQRIVERARIGVASGRWTAPEARVEELLAHQPHLTEGQRAMIRIFATSGNAIDVGVGAAGTGKTTVMAVIDDLATESGIPVVGAALAARTAAGFEAATGIRSSTLTRLVWETRATGGLPKGVVVVVDEAGMVGSRQLAEVSDLVEAASGKLILIGDHHQLAEIDAGGLFRALAVRVPAVELIENMRQDQEWERTALSELRHGSVNRAVTVYERRGRITMTATTDDTISEAVHNWYRDVEAIGDLSAVLLIGHRNTTVDELNKRARTLIADAGLLRGPVLNIHDRMFQTGDRVVCLKNRSRLGVLNGDFATVTAIDTKRRTVTIHLNRNDRSVTVPHWYLDDGYLDWGYALTGHKAQGATVRRAHTVAGDGVDREWIYVTMSRGQEANTIYLTDPELDQDQCMHLAHQHSDRVPALIAALGRTAAEPAALDTGRGPRTLKDEELAARLAGLGGTLGMPETEGRFPVTGGGESEPLIDYVNLYREALARHRDKLATVAYQPPGWVVDTIGERPADHDRSAAWDTVIDRALRYRTDQGIPDEAPDLLGPEPPSSEVDQRVVWMAARRAIQSNLRHLTSPEDQSLSGIGR